jgi:ATP-dependent exoDNAse (exonuclease V) beta subunit
VKTEIEILLPDGKTIRPDRLILEEGRATVIDFKTGKPAESHKKQIRMYEEKIRELGYEKVSGVLLYLNEE